RTSKVEPLKKTVKIITKDDSIKWVRIYLIQKDFQPEKNINDIYSLTIDVTGRKEKERIMTVDKEKAENADRSKSAFLANMSHEIRTPLNAIVGFSELLAGATSNEEKEQYLEILKMNNSMLLQLINDILDMSKIEAGTLEFNFTDVNINVLMSDLERLFQMRLEGNELVKIVFEPSLPKYVISTDRNRLGQVLSNFLSNAVKFTEVGTIRMGYKLYEDGVYFYVSDTGAGMNKEMLDNLFTRFARFHKEKQGNGLGLSISKTIIEKLGGTIGAESVYQKGSTFWFILPNKPSEGHAEEETKVEEVIEIKEEAPQEAEVPLSQSKKGVILIAENSEEVFAPMQDVLSIDYKVLHARTGEEAILTYFQEEPQLVLMALQMPDVDGYQATEAIRQMSTSLPIVALADDDSVDKTEVMNNGFSDVLVKPVSRETLIDTVTRFIK
ncbi:response regulator, partial [Bacteroides sp. OttesenSCG-928-N06]|nr:response regulator [Bacteroides sp. OttesenSCG-928-N06]